MRRNNNNNRNNVVVKAASKDLEDARLEEAQLIASIGGNQMGNIQLPRRDFKSQVIRELIPYGPTNSNFMRTRLLYSLSNVVQQPSLPTLGGLYFGAGLASNFNDLSTVFDQYRIECIAVQFCPVITMNNNSTAVNSPRLYTCIDYDDANPPLNLDVIRSYDTCEITPPCYGVTRTLIPHVANAIYGGVSFNAYGNMVAPWIDVASPGAQHYGIKYGITPGESAQTILQSYSIDVTLFVAFRATR